jgi:hypothetical protein
LLEVLGEDYRRKKSEREFLKSNQVRSLEGATAQAQARDRRHGGRRRLRRARMKLSGA